MDEARPKGVFIADINGQKTYLSDTGCFGCLDNPGDFTEIRALYGRACGDRDASSAYSANSFQYKVKSVHTANRRIGLGCAAV